MVAILNFQNGTKAVTVSSPSQQALTPTLGTGGNPSPEVLAPAYPEGRGHPFPTGFGPYLEGMYVAGGTPSLHYVEPYLGDWGHSFATYVDLYLRARGRRAPLPIGLGPYLEGMHGAGGTPSLQMLGPIWWAWGTPSLQIMRRWALPGGRGHSFPT